MNEGRGEVLCSHGILVCRRKRKQRIKRSSIEFARMCESKAPMQLKYTRIECEETFDPLDRSRRSIACHAVCVPLCFVLAQKAMSFHGLVMC